MLWKSEHVAMTNIIWKMEFRKCTYNQYRIDIDTNKQKKKYFFFMLFQKHFSGLILLISNNDFH